MATVLTKRTVYALKELFRDEFHDVKSSYLTEAVAFSLGFKSHAALIAYLDAVPGNVPPTLTPNRILLMERLTALGYDPHKDASAE